MSKLRSLSTSFWSDPFIEDLTPSQKLLFIYLITNEKTNMLGIYESSIKKISFETGIKKDDVEKALKEFERVGKVRYENNFVILVNYLKHQNFNTNMKKSAIDVYNNLHKELKDNNLILDRNKPFESFETLSKHLGMVRKREVEVEREVEREIEEEYIKEIYNLYPSKCPIKNTPTGKSSNDKNKIKSLLSKKYTFEQLKSIIERYIRECKEGKIFIKNFSTFLNNIPDYSEPEKPKEILYSYIAEGVGLRKNRTKKQLDFDMKIFQGKITKIKELHQ